MTTALERVQKAQAIHDAATQAAHDATQALRATSAELTKALPVFERAIAAAARWAARWMWSSGRFAGGRGRIRI